MEDRRIEDVRNGIACCREKIEKGTPHVVGVMPGLTPTVDEYAASMAELLESRLYAVYADAGSYSPCEGRLVAVDPDFPGGAGGFPVEMSSDLESLLGPAGERWEAVIEGGSAIAALSSIAERVGAAAIVIGSREPGIRSRAREAVSGRVCEGLAHAQSRPVVVVPQSGSGR